MDVDLTLYLLDFVLGDLRHGDGQHVVVNLGCYLVLDDILRAKNIPAWIDYWGYDSAHDWEWWRRQIVYFMGKIVEKKYVLDYVI